MAISPFTAFKAFPSARTMILLVAVCLCGAAAPGQPVVTRIDPPNWWIRHTVNPVRLLVSGTNLTGTSLEAPPGFSVGNLKESTNGSFLFFDLRIPAGAEPGSVPLRVIKAEGSTKVEFSLLAPLSATDRFRGFSSDDVIYLLMPDRFANGFKGNDDPPISRGLWDRSKPRYYHGGDFQGVIDRLPYLKQLGVTALWLTPWYDNVNHLNAREKYESNNQRSDLGRPVTDYHGYGAVDFYAVEEHFGDLSKLRELVEAAHASGLKMIQDQVANHTGPYHPWVTNSPTSTWFNGTVENHLANSWQAWTVAERNPPADQLRSTLDGWFINILPDLNQNDPETAIYLIQNSLWWVGMTGVDAIRQDTLPYVPRSYWAKWTGALKRQYPNVTVLGEMFDANPKLVAFFQGGRKQFDGVDTGVDTLFDFPLFYALRDVFAKGQPMTRLSQSLAADTNYVNARALVTFLGLHDTPRFMSESGATSEGLQLAFTYLLTARGTPMIYYGDEIAMAGGGDPYNRGDFPGGWPEDPHNAFEPAGRQPGESRVHDHVRRLLALRQELPALRRGDTVQLHASDQTCAFARTVGDSAVVVAINNDNRPGALQLTLPAPLAGQSRWFDRLADNAATAASGGVLTLQMRPRSAALLTPERPAVAADHRAAGAASLR